jgi:hypothetical protein
VDIKNNKSGNAVVRKCRTDTDKKKKVESVASVNQLVQHEKKKSWPTRSQKDRECQIQTDSHNFPTLTKFKCNQ